MYVGSWDDCYLNEGVIEFQKRTDAVGGPGWANITILPGKPMAGITSVARPGTFWSSSKVGFRTIDQTAPRRCQVNIHHQAYAEICGRRSSIVEGAKLPLLVRHHLRSKRRLPIVVSKSKLVLAVGTLVLL